MAKASKKVLLSLALIMLFVLPLFTMTFASNESVINAITPMASQAGNTRLTSVVKQILGIIQFIAISIALGMLIIIGISYITSPAEKKAKIKEDAIGYLFGAICIFGAVGILQAIQQVTSVISNGK